MADDQRTEQLRGLLEAYLRTKGIDTRQFFSCLNKPDHQDKHPSMNYYAPGKKVVCHSTCGVKWSIFDLIGHEYGLADFREQKKKADEVLQSMGLIGADQTPPTASKPKSRSTADQTQNPMGTNASYFPKGTGNLGADQEDDDAEAADHTADYMAWHEARHNTNYWEKRGLTAEVVDNHSLRLGYDEKHRAVVIPCTPGYFVSRSITAEIKGDDRFYNQKKVKVRLFNEQALDGPDPVFITEGWADALSIIQVGFPAISLQGANHYEKLLKASKKRNYEIPPIILLLDRDEAGRKYAERLKTGFQHANVPVFDAIVPEEYEDANLMLQGDSGRFRGFCVEMDKLVRKMDADMRNSDLYQTSFKGSLEKYLQAKIKLTYFATGFELLDSYLNGGLQVGVTILGAQSSSGKTTFCLQIANHVAAADGLVMIFSLEQSIDEMIEKSMSMLSDDQLTQFEVRTVTATNDRLDSRWPALIKAGKDLYAYADNIHVIERARTVDQIGAEIARICALTGKTPLVIIDYLQKMLPAKDYQTDKQAVDYNMTILKEISNQHGIPILAISSISRAHYNVDITESAFKESGGIEFSADTSLGLQFTALEGITDPKKSTLDPDAEKAANPRQMQVKVIKQRGGPAGKRSYFDYYAAHNRFSEQPLAAGEKIIMQNKLTRGKK